jgi:signal transduction histidine kinase
MLAASALLAVIISGAFVVLLLAIGDVRGAERRTDHAQNVLVAANQLERLVLDLETGQRGFVLTKQARFLAPWNAARVAYPARARTLLALVDGERVSEHQARNIARSVRAYIRDYSVPLVSAAKRGDPSARSVATTDEGKRRVDALRDDFDRLLAVEHQTAARSRSTADSAAQKASAAAAIGIAVSVFLIGVYAGYLTQAIVRPVRRAAQLAGRFAGGDLTARMPETGAGEIGGLERSFNVMGSSLERSRDALGALAAEQAALRRVATLVARATPRAVFGAVAEEVGRLLDADRTFIGRYGADNAVTVVAAWSATGEQMPIRLDFPMRPEQEESVSLLVHDTCRPARLDSYGHEQGAVARGLGLRSSVGAPITVAGRLWGLIVVASTGDDMLPSATEDRLADFTELVATAITNADAQAELTASRARIVATADETRRRIERDLHDGAQQRLASLLLQLRAAQAAVPSELEQVDDELDRVAQGLAAALEELRDYARGIHPALLAERGLGPAVKALVRRSTVPVDVELHMDGRLPEQIEVGAYYVISEALTNAAKHANASSVVVDVEAIDDVLRLSVRDNGVGGADLSRGSGLVGLKDRVAALGGRISLESPPGGGTSLEVELPLVAERASPA